MAANRPNGPGGSGKTKRTRALELRTEQGPETTCIEIEHLGDWLPADEFQSKALDALKADRDVTVNLGNLDHLDASALQILLALEVEQKKQGRRLRFANASPQLQQWFEFAGAADHFSMIGQKSDE